MGFFRRPARAGKSIEVEPGWETAVQWRIATLDRTRPPSRAALVKAFRDFFAYKCREGFAVNSTQAMLWRMVMHYLVANEAGERGPGLARSELLLAGRALLPVPDDDLAAHLQFSKDIYGELKKNTGPLPAEGGGEPFHSDEFAMHLEALTQFGASVEASLMLRDHAETVGEADAKLWLLTLRGLAREGREHELCEQFEASRASGCRFDRDFHEVMATFYANRDLACDDPEDLPDVIEKAKRWFDRPIDGGGGAATPTPVVFDNILKFGYRTRQAAWVSPIFEALMAREEAPEPGVCDVLVHWRFRQTASPAEAERAMESLGAKRARDVGAEAWPGAPAYNGLLRTAIGVGGGADVTEILELANRKGVAANTATYVILVDWLLDKQNVPQAHAMYREMRSTQDARPGEDAAATNRLLVALCDLADPPFGDIASIVVDLEECSAALDPSALARVCLLYLQHDRFADVADVLSVNLVHLSAQKQERVQDAVAGFCFAEGRSTSRTWETYKLLQRFFPNADRTLRRRFVRLFFRHRRPDMAAKALQHMRGHNAVESRPDADAYVEFFELLGERPDEEALCVAHDMLKIDVRVQPSTRLYNALMIAYNACEMPSHALDFWMDIARSSEGPSYATFEIVFAVCSRKNGGPAVAKKIWRRLASRDVDVTPAVYVRYVSAIGSGDERAHVQEAMELLDKMERAVGRPPEAFTLGIVYNHIRVAEFQVEFRAWAAARHPALWAQLEARGKTLTPNFVWAFRIPDILKADQDPPCAGGRP